MDDDNPAAYKPAPGDKSAKTKPSKYTLKYRQMFGEDSLPIGEEDLNEKIKGLVKKAEKSGISYGILKKVYDRGMAAWRTGHRPGTTPQQWAFARVNSFITGGGQKIRCRFVEEEKMIQFHEFYGKPTTQQINSFIKGMSHLISVKDMQSISENISI